MKITDKNIDVKNARYWSALNDKNLIAILKEICKKSTGKKQLLNEGVFTVTLIIGAICAVVGVCHQWYTNSKSIELQKQGNDLQKRNDYLNRDETVANPEYFKKFKHNEVVQVVELILKPTGSKINVTYTDPETRKPAVAVADEYKIIDTEIKTVVRSVYEVFKARNKGGAEPTKEELIQVMDDLISGKQLLVTKLPYEGMDKKEFAMNMRLVDAAKYKEDNYITDFKKDCRLFEYDPTVHTWSQNGVTLFKTPDLKIDDLQQLLQQLEKDPALKDTSSSKWPWILGIAAAAIGIPLLWSCLSKVTKEVKTSKLLAKCEFACSENSMTYCFGFNLKEMKWTLSAGNDLKISSEETSSFAKTEFAKKFADAVEILMKNFYSENGSKPVYKAVEVAGKDKAELIKLLYNNKDKIESSLYNMTKCEAA